MSIEQKPELPEAQAAYSRQIGIKAKRMIKAKGKEGRSIWLGLGTVGIIGWSVALPTLVGVALGIWLDHRHPSRHSWTLALMIIGLVIGCWIAWNWVAKENTEIKQE